MASGVPGFGDRGADLVPGGTSGSDVPALTPCPLSHCVGEGGLGTRWLAAAVWGEGEIGSRLAGVLGRGAFGCAGADRLARETRWLAARDPSPPAPSPIRKWERGRTAVRCRRLGEAFWAVSARGR